MEFKRSSYEVMEDEVEVMRVLRLSQPSADSFEVMISAMDVTAKGE